MIKQVWEMIYQHHDAVLPARACTVRIPVGRSTTTEPTSVPHNREDYDGDDDTLVAWARAIGDDDSNDYGSDHMPDTKPH